MKFVFADALDMIDPEFDFIQDRAGPNREMYWGDVYPHEYFETPPYDGVLVSRGIVGDDLFPGKYPEVLMMRFRRVGARSFLRLEAKRFAKMNIFGDCGAFSYAQMDEPPYSPEMMLDFYSDGGFTHGCSVDHIIFDFNPNSIGLQGASASAKRRFEITLQNAAKFLKLSKDMGRQFTPLGVVQGWSPDSMAAAARWLERMGYGYLAIGGMVPLNAAQIHVCLQAIRKTVSKKVKLHLLGFAKADQIHEFTKYGIASFDSTSPLTRAFKDDKANYYQPTDEGRLEYFTAIRIPQATANARFKRHAKSVGSDQERLTALERTALEALRAFDCKKMTLDQAAKAVMVYSREFLCVSDSASPKNEARLERTERALRETLEQKPWSKCPCKVCRQAGIETIIFRGSNRNKRRGFHNLMIYYNHLRRCIV